jgi:hypothetical protein
MDAMTTKLDCLRLAVEKQPPPDAAKSGRGGRSLLAVAHSGA